MTWRARRAKRVAPPSEGCDVGGLGPGREALEAPLNQADSAAHGAAGLRLAWKDLSRKKRRWDGSKLASKAAAASPVDTGHCRSLRCSQKTEVRRLRKALLPAQDASCEVSRAWETV